MDKLRVALNWIVAHHFWLLSGLVVLIAIGVWVMAASDLQQKYKTNVGTIDSAFQKQNGYVGKAFLPNERVNEAQQREINLLIEDVERTWTDLYQRQREEALVWPPQLSPSFRSYIASRKFGDPIAQNHRSDYFNYIRGRFDDLPKIINANTVDPNTPGIGGGGYGGEGGRRGGFSAGGANRSGPTQEIGPDGRPIEENFVVWWAPEDQMRIQEDLTSTQVESHWKIWTTQEDLWVYETVLRAIAATNEDKGAVRYSNAAIRSLYAMEVGRPAAEYSRTPGRIHRLEVRGGEGVDGDLSGGYSPQGGEFGGEAEGGEMMEGEYGAQGLGQGQQLTPAEEKAVMLSRRYIDKEGKPIPVPADDMPLEPSLLGTGFKQLPLRLDLEMDTRWISTLIVKMANAPLRIMVTEVRVNPLNVEGGTGGGRGRGGFEGGYGRSLLGGGFGNQQQIQIFDRQPHIKQVILQGVVQIFHEPDTSVLGSPEGEMEQSGEFASYP